MRNQGPSFSRRDVLGGAVLATLAAFGFERSLGRLAGTALAAAAVEAPIPSIAVRELPASGARAPATLAGRFNLLGIHWRGPGSVSFRTLGATGWSAWQRAQVHELAEGAEARRDGWRLGTPVFTDTASRVEVRTEGKVERVRVHEIWSPPGSPARLPASASPPFVIPRSGWGADESIVRAEPSYAVGLRFAVVHHTAGKSPANPGQSAAIVRGIQRYHVLSNGWNDIGYNFLLDGFGQVFEGRGGGVDRDVIGAHALGFNTGSAGIAVLGNLENEPLTPAARAALVRLLAWRLDLGHVDPLALVSATSTSGSVRTLRAVSGHRDVGSTACPGANLFPQLDGIAAEAAATGLPKLYEPRLEQSGRTVRFTARLSDALPWSVTVTGPSGSTAASGGGVSAAVDWTWDATAVPDGRYAWRIEAGPSVTPASGSLALGSSSAPAEETPRPARPGGIPRRIPRWAWPLRNWHRAPKAGRGPRPRAPRPLPAWYWPWFRWLNALERWQRERGG